MNFFINIILLNFIICGNVVAGDNFPKEKKMSLESILNIIEKLPELALPDEWYELSNDLSLDKKFEGIANKMASLSLEDIPLADRVLELKNKYCKKHKLFKHTIYFNKPVSIDFPEASYLITIVSCDLSLYTSLKAIDFIKAKKNKENLPTKINEVLIKIFN